MSRGLILAAAAVAVLGAAPSAFAQGQRDPGQFLERADLNGDGKITRAEMTEMRGRMFDRMDRNKDGVVDDKDAPKRRFRQAGGERYQELVRFLDGDSNGKITRDEVVNGPNLLFEHGDANADGVIDQQELAALKQAAASRRAR